MTLLMVNKSVINALRLRQQLPIATTTSDPQSISKLFINYLLQLVN